MSKPGLVVSYSPHWHCDDTVSSAMYTFVLALMPTTLFGLYLYGMDAARVIAVAMVSCVASEALIQRLFRKPVTVTDGSAVLTGLLLGLILPASAPYWLVTVGGLVSILVGKQIYGGLGSNPFNAVLVGWAVVKISWKARMDLNLAFVNYDLDMAYPLGLLCKGGAAAIGKLSLLDLFLGKELGGIGCASDLLICLGGVFLIWRGLISWRIPAFFLIGVVLASSAFWMADGARYAPPLFHLVTGDTMIAAFFLAPDYASSPVNPRGKVLFGLGCGVLVAVLRVWSIYPDGTFFAILLMNLFSPLLDRVPARRRPRCPVVIA